MYIDASVIIAILNQESDWRKFKHSIDGAKEELLVSSLTIFEAATGLARARIGKTARKNTPAELERAVAAVREFAAALDIHEIELRGEIGRLALEAAMKYGKNRGPSSPIELWGLLRLRMRSIP